MPEAERAIEKRWRYFTLEEFSCRCCGQVRMAHDFIDKLDQLRAIADFPFVINSGYRCPNHNSRVSSTGRTGPHTTGRAADIRVYGVRAYTVLEHALRLDFTGIGISQRVRVRSARFVHLDDLANAPNQPRPWVWSY